MASKKRKLNIGCGSNWRIYKDYEGLDIKDYGQVHVGYVEILLPQFPAEGFDEVMANHFLEHFDQDDLLVLFNAIHRVLKPGGLLKFVVPHKKKPRAWILSHKSFWNEEAVRWLGEKETDEVYNFGRWKIKQLIVNKRKDIHAWLIKK